MHYVWFPKSDSFPSRFLVEVMAAREAHDAVAQRREAMLAAGGAGGPVLDE
jgi:hypothetical protein